MGGNVKKYFWSAPPFAGLDYNSVQMHFLTPTLPFIIWLQSFSSLRVPMALLSFLGTTYFFLFALPLIYWCVNRRIGLSVGFLVLANALINDLLKVVFALPRPYWISPLIHPWAAEASFGLPSGHTQGAVVFWLFLALQVQGKWRRPALSAALCICGLIGLSRIYLGAHFPADVAAGFAMGALVLALYVGSEKRFHSWLAQQSQPLKIVAAAGCLGLVFLCYALLISRRSIGQFAPYDARALSWDSITSYAGAILGLTVGVATRDSAPIPPGILMRLLRCLTGFAVLLVLWIGLAKLSPGLETTVVLCLRFFRYFIVTWWVIDGAPRLFGIWEKRLALRI